MRIAKRLAAVAAVGAIAVGSIAVAPAASASEPGNTSLAAVLGNDLVPGNGFDHNWDDFDIVREAIDAVIATKGVDGTPVALLADGDVALTAFIPTDRAFRRLVHNLTGSWLNEKKTFEAVASLGIDTVEAVLLYHVVPGATIDSATALGADGAALTTAQGGTFTVSVRSVSPLKVRLVDNDPDALNPLLIPADLDINAGNLQIAHGIARVLRPINL